MSFLSRGYLLPYSRLILMDSPYAITRAMFEREKRLFLENANFTQAQRRRVSKCTLKFGKMKTAVGMAHSDGILELSSHFVEVGFEVWDTIIHELAHIAVGVEHGHDNVWLGVYRELGGVGSRLVEIPEEYWPKAKWTLKCTKCTWSVQRYRRTYSHCYFCAECEAPMIFKLN